MVPGLMRASRKPAGWRANGSSPASTLEVMVSKMNETNYEVMNVEGGRHVKMWTQRRAGGRAGEAAAREHRAYAVRALAPGRDAGRARRQGRDRGLGDRDQGRDHPGGGGRGHRLRHDGRADHAQGERSAGIAGEAARAHRARRAAWIGDGSRPRAPGFLGQHAGLGAYALGRARGASRRHRREVPAPEDQGAAQAARNAGRRQPLHRGLSRRPSRPCG